jgi:hypothetical protein
MANPSEGKASAKVFFIALLSTYYPSTHCPASPTWWILLKIPSDKDAKRFRISREETSRSRTFGKVHYINTFAVFAVTDNCTRLAQFVTEVTKLWLHQLRRRSQAGRASWH